jgi:hypothetical protein
MKDFSLNLRVPHHTLTQISPRIHEGCQESETAFQHWRVMFPIQKRATFHHVAGQIHPLSYVEPACRMESTKSSQSRSVYRLLQRGELQLMEKVRLFLCLILNHGNKIYGEQRYRSMHS